MVVEVILGEVGEYGAAEAAARHPLLIEGMGAHLHRSQPGAGRHRRRQLALQPIGEGRGVLGGDAVARPAVHQGAEQGRRLSGGAGQMLNQIGGGGLAVGAGDADQTQLPARLVPEGGCQFAGRAGQIVRQHQHRICCGRWYLAGSGRTDNGGGRPGLQHLGPVGAAIHRGAAQAEEQITCLNPAGITAEARELRVGQSRRHRQARVMQQQMEQLGHGNAGWMPPGRTCRPF